ncbi:hypothetical protein P153DRAFT_290518 [Dothidotthia symphoricarpi CBS 119687]|uniref:Ribonuclease P/MRP protein subunit POP5 n=1 Tax=Dothidotthia symphoricarpi CBS 119687 TaxID=1392245 RepID=A0A6A6AGA4_9PLEO|nr:uncharacterized protein P153DRAFT_290518 [Dothidotthia symphoricarpi CBS 119687]KAF2129451.1 hypothetical protein P153DRAFT_290518 [Dothidotthia symphoricarpi CBS 119687]
MVRVKFRYLVVNFLYPEPASKGKAHLPDLVQTYSPTPDSLHQGLLVRLIRDGVSELYGDYGMGMISGGLKVNYWSPSTSTAIIRCPRDHYEMVWAALTFVTRLPRPIDLPVVARVVRVSGTIKKAEEEVIKRSQQIIKKATKVMDGGANLPMLQAVQKSVGRERQNESEILTQIDDSDESGDMSEDMSE